MKNADTLGSLVADLSKVVTSYSQNEAAARQSFNHLASADPAVFFAAGIRVAATAVPSPGLRFLMLTLAKDKRLSAGLLDPNVCTVEEASAVMRAALDAGAQMQASFEIALNKAVQAHASPQNAERILRILELLGVIPGQNWNSFQVELMAYPDSVVRAKATLLIGRSTRNVAWIARRLLDRDPRVQASGVEALWGLEAEETKPHLLGALQSKNNQVVVNAVLGLYWIGDTSAPRRLMEMLRDEDPLVRSTALWAIGETQDDRFLAALSDCYKNSEGKARLAAVGAMSKIRRREKPSEDAARLQIHLSQVAVQPERRRRLALALSCHPARDLSGVKATDFALWENGALIEEYDVRLVNPPALLLVGFVAPFAASESDAYEHSLREGLKQCLSMKRADDVWRIDRYSVEINPKPDEKAAQESTLPYADPLVTPELKAAFGCVSDSNLLARAIGLPAHAATDPLVAFERQCNAFAKRGGKRHVFLFLHEMSGFDLKQDATIARLRTLAEENSVVLHGICPDVAGQWALVRELCLSQPEGSFSETKVDTMVDAIVDAYANLSSRFEITYALPDSVEAGKVRLRISGSAGDAETSLDLPAEPPAAVIDAPAPEAVPEPA